MIARTAFIVAVASCAGHSAMPDSGSDAAGSDALPRDGSSGADAAPDAAACLPGGAKFSACCVWSTCDTGLSCYLELASDAGPDSGGCYPTGATPIGDRCTITGHVCVDGAFCAFDDQTPTTGLGTCRVLCDPLDTAAHGCAAGTCNPIPEDANHHVGVCL